jgi:hypothetical protein
MQWKMAESDNERIFDIDRNQEHCDKKRHTSHMLVFSSGSRVAVVGTIIAAALAGGLIVYISSRIGAEHALRDFYSGLRKGGARTVLAVRAAE